MRFRVACNWDPALLEGLRGLPVNCLFGSLAPDLVGGGRPAAALPKTTRDNAIAFIQRVRAAGMDFNYTLNAPCLDNREFTPEFGKAFDELMEWVTAAGATEVTVTVPVLAQRLRRRYPDLKLACSVFNRVASVRQAQRMEQLGYDDLVLEFTAVNRDLRLIEAIRHAVRCRLTLVANVVCLYECATRIYHANCDGHSSQYWHPLYKQPNRYCYLQCTVERFGNPVEFIRTPWIRPEDVATYEQLGIDCLKIAERTQTTDWILRAARAYTAGRYDGNLLDLVSYPEKMLRYVVASALPDRPLPDRLCPALDNRALDGFLDFFRTNDCRYTDCDVCGYCAGVARKALRAEHAALVAEAFAKVRDGVIDGCPSPDATEAKA